MSCGQEKVVDGRKNMQFGQKNGEIYAVEHMKRKEDRYIGRNRNG